MRLLVSAGGTGGGVYPALAVVDALRGRADVLWVGAQGGMEAELVRRNGLAFHAIPAAGLHGVGPRALPGNLRQIARGLSAAREVLRRFQPEALFFTGGYVGVPVALAGWRLPKLAFVPDIEPALALRMITRAADAVAVTTEDSRRFYPRGEHVVVTGYPVRRSLLGLDRAGARRALELGDDLPVLLVLGGSRGARSLNRAVWAVLPRLLGRAQVVHLTGELDWPEAEPGRLRLSPDLADRYHPFAYLHEEMGAALAAADLAVSRAGASTLGEYPAFGLPSILVPYPHAWRYQRVNAAYLAERGAAVQIRDEALGAELLPAVLDLLGDERRRAAMGAAARALAAPGAAEAIADEIARLPLRNPASKGGPRG